MLRPGSSNRPPFSSRERRGTGGSVLATAPGRPQQSGQASLLGASDSCEISPSLSISLMLEPSVLLVASPARSCSARYSPVVGTALLVPGCLQLADCWRKQIFPLTEAGWNVLTWDPSGCHGSRKGCPASAAHLLTGTGSLCGTSDAAFSMRPLSWGIRCVAPAVAARLLYQAASQGGAIAPPGSPACDWT